MIANFTTAHFKLSTTHVIDKLSYLGEKGSSSEVSLKYQLKAAISNFYTIGIYLISVENFYIFDIYVLHFDWKLFSSHLISILFLLKTFTHLISIWFLLKTCSPLISIWCICWQNYNEHKDQMFKHPSNQLRKKREEQYCFEIKML